MKTYTWVADPGHAWLVVPITDIPLAVKERITPYSYKNKGMAYLEEDCDAGLFLNFLKEKEIEFKLQADHLNSDHPCRRYSRFTN